MLPDDADTLCLRVSDETPTKIVAGPLLAQFNAIMRAEGGLAITHGSRKAIGGRHCCGRAAALGRQSGYSEAEYLLQKQSEQRAEWAASVRAVTGSRRHQFWEPQLDPPALLEAVSIVLVSPRRPVSLGTVARSASCFEVSDLRVVKPRGEYVTRHSKSASKGAQYLLFKAANYESVAEATKDADLSVAFTRWVSGRSSSYYDLSALIAHPTIQALIHEPVRTPSEPASEAGFNPEAGARGASDAEAPSSSGRGAQEAAGVHTAGPRKRVRVALVFGREELGLADEEVDACDAVCSIPIGRLQESLSLSHAVSIALSGIYSQRLAAVAGAAGSGGAAEGAGRQEEGAGSKYVVRSLEGLAAGYETVEGGTEQ